MKEKMMKNGLSEKDAQAAVDVCSSVMRAYIPKHRFDEVNNRLKEATKTLALMREQSSGGVERCKSGQVTIALQPDTTIELTLKQKSMNYE